MDQEIEELKEKNKKYLVKIKNLELNNDKLNKDSYNYLNKKNQKLKNQNKKLLDLNIKLKSENVDIKRKNKELIKKKIN